MPAGTVSPQCNYRIYLDIIMLFDSVCEHVFVTLCTCVFKYVCVHAFESVCECVCVCEREPGERFTFAFSIIHRSYTFDTS